MKVIEKFVCAFFALTFAAVHPKALAETENISLMQRRCDQAAAYPYDTQKPADIKGVYLTDLNGRNAVEVCGAALRSGLSVGRNYFQLGRAYEKLENYAQAANFYTEAINKGHAMGAQYLGMLYQEGKGVPQNFDKAHNLFVAGAKAGVLESMAKLSEIYRGEIATNQPKNLSIGNAYLIAAANGGRAPAQSSLGAILESGDGIKQDIPQAVRYYQMATNQGYGDAMSRLANCYAGFADCKSAVKTNDAYALQLFRKSVELDSNDGAGLNGIGNFYYSGRGGLAEDPREAERYWKLAVKRSNNESAKANLEMLSKPKHEARPSGCKTISAGPLYRSDGGYAGERTTQVCN